jgi:uncharacterized protein
VPRPLVVRVGDLLREPGSRRDVDVSVDLSPLETSAARVIPGTDQTVDAEVMAMAGGVEITGTVGFDWYGECRRCLEDVDGHLVVEFREVAQREPVDEEVLPIDGDLLDLEPLVRELVLAGLPLAPLCGPDCAGPDPERFPTATEAALEAEQAEQAGAEPVRDPRWAALDDLDFD